MVDQRDVIDAFRSYLRDHNLPVTNQRIAVASVVLLSNRHQTADDIARELRARGASVGQATVYRTLELLVGSGLAVERDFGEGYKRYESARDEPHHEHLLCTVCGHVTEFRDERLDRMTALVAETHGFARHRHRLVILGVCRACQSGTTRR
ncbi:MAG: Ferric uptake regulation protein [Gemmatimonadaceae bacterium]|nr:Ferric uptake regulation protein [Gemmatimonadaceae bacterium]